MRVPRQRQAGVFALWLAVLFPVLIAFFALLIESANLIATRQEQQTATDAAALAGALQALGHDRGEVMAAARFAATRNGYTEGPETQLTIERPPSIGWYAGDERAIRVTIQHQPSRLLSAVFPEITPGISTAATARFSRAVCLLTLSPTASASLSIAANATIVGPNCSAQINSAATGAFVVGNRANVELLDLRVTGTSSVGGNAVVVPNPTDSALAIADPLSGLAEITPSGCDYNNRVVSGTQTLSPGVYCGGIRLNANARATLTAGNYVLVGGPLELRNNAQLSGEQITLHLLQGSQLLINASAQLRITAAESGAYRGFLIFESRATALDTVAHNIPLRAATLLQGLIYLSRSSLSLVSDTQTPANQESSALAIIARNLTLSGRVQLNFESHVIPDLVRQKAWLAE